MKLLAGTVACLLVACSSAGAVDISGAYIDESNPSETLVLTEKSDGTVSGTFEGELEAMPISARHQGDQLTGTLGSGADATQFRAKIAGNRISFQPAEGGAATLRVFVRTGAAETAMPAETRTAQSAGAAPVPAAAQNAEGRRNVSINDQRLSDEELARLEQTYRVKVVDADYWYDTVSGGWGIKGGPTRGFVYSGLNLGGKLKADASGGGTNVFINGRELHPMDVAGLQRCMPVMPGRYWVMADGTGGYEGGPALFNVVSLCSPKNSSGRSGGWLCDGGSCGTDRTVTGASGVVSEGGGQAGVYTDQGLILTPN